MAMRKAKMTMDNQEPVTDCQVPKPPVRAKIYVTASLCLWAAIMGFYVGRASVKPTIVIGEKIRGEIKVIEIKDGKMTVFDKEENESEKAKPTIDIVENL